MKYLLAVLFLASAQKISAQNIGIGTNTPAEKLQVVGNIKTDTAKLNALQLNVNAAAGKILTTDAAGNGSWQTNAAFVKALNGLTKTNDSIVLGGLLQANTMIRLNANSLLMTDTGSVVNVAVNQTSFPLSTALSGTAVTQSFIANNNGNLSGIDIYIAAFSGAAVTMQLQDNTGAVLGTTTNNFASFFNGWSSFNVGSILLNSGKKYVVLLTAPGSAQVYYDNSNPYPAGLSNLGGNADLSFRVFTMDEKNAFIVKAGRVGINNANPSADLDIIGSVKITDGTQGNGKVLTGDANGKGSWQSISSLNVGAWGITGNTNTNSAHYLGTTDNQPIRFRVNNTRVGELHPLTGNVFFGLNAGQQNSTGFSNVAIGRGALTNNTDRSNTVAVGDSALFNNGIGAVPISLQAIENTAIGSKSMFSNTIGQANTAIGNAAMFYNISGSDNTAVGDQALYYSVDGTSNTATGFQSMYMNQNGANNTANGYQAMFGNTSGTGNTAIGLTALYNNTVGNNNVAIGYDALLINSTGSENTATGPFALYANSTGNYNNAIGSGALTSNNSGSENVALGQNSLGYNNSGNANIAIGTTALFSNISGYGNVAIGKNALRSSIDRSNLVAIGDSALYKNGTGASFATEGTANTAVGSKTLFNNTTGSFNTALGSQSLFTNSSGNSNTALGQQALYSNTTGYSNTAIGIYALNANTTGHDNIADGFSALSNNTTGYDNTVSGHSAMGANKTGFNNVATGSFAIQNNIDGSNNTAVGYSALQGNNSGNNNTAIGNSAAVSNKTGYSNVAVGGRALFSNMVSTNNVAVGDSALYTANGGTNVAVGSKALFSVTNGTANTAIGYKADVNGGSLVNSTTIGANSVVQNSNAMMFGNSAVTTWGFGRTFVAGGTAIQVGSSTANGNSAYLTSGGVWTNSSDSTKKEEITELDGASLLTKIKELRVTRWKYKGTEEYHIGPMAQDFYRIFKVGINNTGISSVDPAGIALRAIQEQQAIIESQNKRIEKLEQEVELLLKKQAD